VEAAFVSPQPKGIGRGDIIPADLAGVAEEWLLDGGALGQFVYPFSILNSDYLSVT